VADRVKKRENAQGGILTGRNGGRFAEAEAKWNFRQLMVTRRKEKNGNNKEKLSSHLLKVKCCFPYIGTYIGTWME
jgi:hypothetical protein